MIADNVDCYQWAGNKLILNLLLECVGKDVVCDDAFGSANCCKPGLSCKMRYDNYGRATGRSHCT